MHPGVITSTKRSIQVVQYNTRNSKQSCIFTFGIVISPKNVAKSFFGFIMLLSWGVQSFSVVG